MATTLDAAMTEEEEKEHQAHSPIQQFCRKWWTTGTLTIATIVISSTASIVHFTASSKTTDFFLNTVALIPCGALLRHCVRHVVSWIRLRGDDDAHWNALVAGVVDSLMGPAPELIFAVVALCHDRSLVVQTAIMGAILSNSLLVLGLCFIFGAWRQDIDNFPHALAMTNARLLFIATGGLICISIFVTHSEDGSEHLTSLSHAAAVVFLLLYACYWWFFFGPPRKPTIAPRKRKIATLAVASSIIAAPLQPSSVTPLTEQLAQIRRQQAAAQKSRLHPCLALLLALAAAALSIWSTTVLLQSMDTVIEDTHVSETFLGLVVLPFVTTTVDNAMAVLHARRKDMDWSMQATVVSSIQIALFVLPIAIFVGWGTGLNAMTLSFDMLQTGLVFLTASVISFIFQAPEGRWVEGAMLIAFYCLMVISAWYYPNSA